MKIINMTPHNITLIKEDGNITFESKGSIRLGSKTTKIGNLGGIPIVKTEYDTADNLPKQRDDVYYIVSSLLCRAYPDREDFLIVSETVRDVNGKITGCKSLSINPFKNRK